MRRFIHRCVESLNPLAGGWIYSVIPRFTEGCVGGFIDLFLHSLIDVLHGASICTFMDSLVDSLVDALIRLLMDSLTDSLSDSQSLSDSWIDPLIDSLVEWLRVLFID